MALTPEDVVNKRFQPTKFREGYDQDEVDDFLDEVVVELRRLGQENEELRQRLIGSESRISELQRGGSSAASAATPIIALPEPAAELAPEPESAPETEAAREPESAREPEPAAASAAVIAPIAPAAVAPVAELDPNSTNNLLQLARRLHEEHVREGVEKRDSLIAEGHSNAAKLVADADAAATKVGAEAEAAATKVGADAEAKQRAQVAKYDQERAGLQSRIDELRTFEREYRQKLKGYIEGQLRELDAAGGVSATASASETSDSYGSGSA